MINRLETNIMKCVFLAILKIGTQFFSVRHAKIFEKVFSVKNYQRFYLFFPVKYQWLRCSTSTNNNFEEIPLSSKGKIRLTFFPSDMKTGMSDGINRFYTCYSYIIQLSQADLSLYRAEPWHFPATWLVISFLQSMHGDIYMYAEHNTMYTYHGLPHISV